jgi:hypothetical protein
MVGFHTRATLGFLLLGTLSVLPTMGQQKHVAEVTDSVETCKAKDSSLSDFQCARWLARKDFVHKAACPDHDSGVACSSFEELVKADDTDMMHDLAQQDHVYTCFRPQQDVFLEIYYSDPDDGVWQKDEKAPNTSFLRGEAEVRYYKSGIASTAMSFHSEGKWTYPLGEAGANSSNPETTDSGAVFDSENVQIRGSRFEASQVYKNESGVNIHHAVVLQLSTGRFTEKFDMQPSGEAVDEYSGRCFVLPLAP